MIFTSRQIVWTPILAGDGLAVALDQTFAEVCMTHEMNDMPMFIEAVWKLMGNKPSIKPSNFLDIHKGILPKGFYAGRDGLWLTLDSGTVSSSKRPLIYHGHNEDQYASDRLWLLRAFGAWAEIAVIVLNFE